MSTISRFNAKDINAGNPVFSALRTTVETSFYRNNVVEVKDIAEAYEMAANSPGTIVTDMEVYEPEKLGLPKGAKVLLFNDGAITGRYAKARVILGDEGIDAKEYTGIAREAEYHSRFKKMYHAQAVIGLDAHFMVRAHLLIPEGHENLLYSWMLNFQYVNDEYEALYAKSVLYEEGDIYVFSNPDYYPVGREDGLALFDPPHNTAMILGLRYFGASTTLYNAALRADLTILERRAHTMPVGYVARGCDGAVSYGALDIKVRNDFDFPIFIAAFADGNNVTFQIYGDTTTKDYEVQISSEQVGSVPSRVVEKVDPNAEPGSRVVEEQGRTGLNYVTYKTKIRNGEVLSSEQISADYYPATNTVVVLGPPVPEEPENPEVPADPNNPTVPVEPQPTPQPEPAPVPEPQPEPVPPTPVPEPQPEPTPPSPAPEEQTELLF